MPEWLFLLSIVPLALQLSEPELEHRRQHGFHRPTSKIRTTDRERQLAFLSRLWDVDYDVLECNFARLMMMTNRLARERMYRFSASYTDAYLHEDDYSMALEFYLQVDRHLFYMKTCSYRGAQPLPNERGLFCTDDPRARYSFNRCHRSACCLCFPRHQLTHRQDKPVVQFGSNQEHSFVHGYRSILNCSATCTTRNIIYVLTCPCHQVDYIGETSLSLASRLSCKLKSIPLPSPTLYSDHRQHGNRIVQECMLGQKNILRIRPESKSTEYRSERWLLPG